MTRAIKRAIKRTIRLCLAAGALLVAACVGVPDGVSVVRDFDAGRYLGTWYEIARLDHRFERGLSNVTATYAKRPDDGIAVLNRGYDDAANAWVDAEGKAYFVESPDVGRLKVSFFGPFYGAYNVIELDGDGYTYSMVAGPNRSYLWILSRTPDLDPAIYDRLVGIAADLGFPTDELIRVDHGRADANRR